MFNSSKMLGRFQTELDLMYANDKGIVLTNNIQHWKIHRGVAEKGIMKIPYLREIAKMVADITKGQFEIWTRENGSNSFTLDVHSSLSAITLDIIGMAAFTTDLKAREGTQTAYRKHITDLMEGISYFRSRPKFMRIIEFKKWRQFKEAINHVRDINSVIISGRRENKSKFFDFLDMLLNSSFTNDEIGQDINDLLAAGHETTAVSMAFSLYFLAEHPDVQSRLQEESDTFPSLPTYEDCANMKLFNGLIKETLRIFPTAPINARTSLSDTEVKFKDNREIPLPKDSMLMYSVFSLGLDATHYSNPEKFNIDRWENGTENVGAWLPFGLGSRVCLGNKMAMTEMAIMLCMIMQRYSIRMLPNTVLEVESSLTLHPKNLKLVFFPREKHQ